jgi:NADPH:quinone reductase-like Zn-dependent oxidoreductase
VLAAFATAPNPSDPMAALEVGDRPDPQAPDGWTTVTVRAASINHHDVWTLRGVGLAEDKYPMILGCDASGVDADETLDPRRTLLSEKHQGTLAEQVIVPARNVLPKPSQLSHEEAACLSTAWLTAYRMLFVKSGVRPGATVLVQGASGGVATALIALGSAAGYRMWATGRTEAKRQAALELGADAVFEPGARLPKRVHAVMETVGDATWSHSLKSLAPGGTIVVCGATSGPNPAADLNRVFFLQLSVVGSTMGTRAELESLMDMLVTTGLRPVIDTTMPLAQAADGFAKIVAGDTAGKIVLTV